MDLVRVEELCSLFGDLGVEEMKPKSKKHLNFDDLDLKSKRILNRIADLINRKHLTIESFLRDIITI